MNLDEETKADLLALAELSPELSAVSELLREHVANEYGLPVCGEVDFEVDLLVTAALALRVVRGERRTSPVAWDSALNIRGYMKRQSLAYHLHGATNFG